MTWPIGLAKIILLCIVIASLSVDLQEPVKGSQGAGRVDDSLDSSIAGNEPVAEPSKPKAPARPAGAKGKKKGRR